MWRAVGHAKIPRARCMNGVRLERQTNAGCVSTVLSGPCALAASRKPLLPPHAEQIRYRHRIYARTAEPIVIDPPAPAKPDEIERAFKFRPDKRLLHEVQAPLLRDCEDAELTKQSAYSLEETISDEKLANGKADISNLRKMLHHYTLVYGFFVRTVENEELKHASYLNRITVHDESCRRVSRFVFTLGSNKQEQVVPNVEECQFFLAHAVLKREPFLFKKVYEDLLRHRFLKLDEKTLTTALAGFTSFSDVEKMLDVYEKLYKNGILPTVTHWAMMLRGTSLAGDLKHFSRFYQRILRKGYTIPDGFLTAIFAKWGSRENFQWKISKKCNTALFDYLHMLTIVLHHGCYKLAVHLLNEYPSLGKAPTPQLLEKFLWALRKDFPLTFGEEARQWRLRLKSRYLPLDIESHFLDQPTLDEFNGLVERVVKHIGRKHLSKFVPTEALPTKPERLSRKKLRIMHGYHKVGHRYESEFTKDTDLFEFVPEFGQRVRLARAKRVKALQQKREKDTIDLELERARVLATEWRSAGFRGSLKVGEE